MTLHRILTDSRDEHQLVHVSSRHLANERRGYIPAEEDLNGGRDFGFVEQRLERLAGALLHEREDVVRLRERRIVHGGAAGLEIFKVDLEVVLLVVEVLEEGLPGGERGDRGEPVTGRVARLSDAPIHKYTVASEGANKLARASYGVGELERPPCSPFPVKSRRRSAGV